MCFFKQSFIHGQFISIVIWSGLQIMTTWFSHDDQSINICVRGFKSYVCQFIYLIHNFIFTYWYVTWPLGYRRYALLLLLGALVINIGYRVLSSLNLFFSILSFLIFQISSGGNSYHWDLSILMLITLSKTIPPRIWKKECNPRNQSIKEC